MSNKNKSKKADCSIVFFIGNAFVEALVVDFRSKQKVEILLSEKKFLKIEKNFKPDIFLKNTNNALKKTCDAILKSSYFGENLIEVKNIQLIFSEPWYDAKSEDISFYGKENFEVSKDEVEESIEQAIEEFLEISKKSENEKQAKKKFLMERKGIQMFLNGYPVEEIKNVQTSDFKINIFLSVLSEKARSVFTDTLSRYFNEREVYFHSLALSSWISVRDEFTKKDRFVVMNICGEMTEVIFSIENSIKKISSFPRGYNSIIRDISKNTKEEVEVVRSKFNLYVKNELEEEEMKKIQEELDKTKEEWVSWLSQKMENFSEDFAIPDTIFILTPEHFFNWFASLSKNKELYKYTVLEKPYETMKIDSKKFVNFIKDSSSMKSSPFSLISILYLKKYNFF